MGAVPPRVEALCRCVSRGSMPHRRVVQALHCRVVPPHFVPHRRVVQALYCRVVPPHFVPHRRVVQALHCRVVPPHFVPHRRVVQALHCRVVPPHFVPHRRVVQALHCRVVPPHFVPHRRVVQALHCRVVPPHFVPHRRVVQALHCRVVPPHFVPHRRVVQAAQRFLRRGGCRAVGSTVRGGGVLRTLCRAAAGGRVLHCHLVQRARRGVATVALAFAVHGRIVHAMQGGGGSNRLGSVGCLAGRQVRRVVHRGVVGGVRRGGGCVCDIRDV